MRKAARKFRVLATELSGLMIKAGQFVSSRLDVLPVLVTRELEVLQDEVQPEPFATIRQQLETALGMPIEIAFEEFSQIPLASASLGQVHRAKLPRDLIAGGDSPDVVVKILRPRIEEVIAVDLQALRKIGLWMSKVRLVSRRANVPALVEEFAHTTYEEIDYLVEAKNLELFAENFQDDPFVFTPNVIWYRSSKRALTLTDVSAIKISDIASLVTAGINPSQVATEYTRSVFQQIFVDGFFHADPHPGNVFIAPIDEKPGGFKIVFVDFGMMGKITPKQQRDLRSLIFALASRDAPGMVRSMESLGLLLPNADTVQLISAVEVVFSKFAGVGVTDIVNTDPREFIALAKEFSELVRQFPFQIPENFLLLGRSISIVSGVASALNPKFNIWDAIDPFARYLLRSKTNYSQNLLASLISNVALISRLPSRIDQVISKLERGELVARNAILERTLVKIQRSSVRTAILVSVNAVIATFLWLALGKHFV